MEPLYKGQYMNKGHFFNEETVCSPNHIELCTNLPLNFGIPLYTGQTAGS